MARIAVVALVLATMLVAGMAVRDTETTGFSQSRSLKQNFKCPDAKRLQNGGCQQVQDCVAKNAPSLNTPNNVKLFQSACAKCAAAGNSCAGDDLPQACKGGLSNSAIMKCVNQLMAGH